MNKKIGIMLPVTLGFLTAFGPFVTDFYLPALPQMGDYFHTSPSLIQMSLTASMLGLAAGQILIGPLTDKFGRKGILVVSMVIFVLATLGSIYSPDIIVFNSLRFVQGVSGAGGIVISKSISTDMFSGKDLANFMAIIGAINGIAPVCAPVVGGVVMNFTTWQGVFVVLLAVGVILTVLSCLLRESLPKNKRMKSSVVYSYMNLFRVFRNQRFVRCTFAQMFCMLMFFGYIASSPFILQQIYGLTPFQFSLCFALNAIAIGVGSGCCTLFKKQSKCLKCGAIDLMIASVCVSFVLIAHLSIIFLMAAYMYLMFSFGLMQPPTTALALDSERNNAGSASAILGASGFVAGGISTPLVSLGNMLISTSTVLTISAFLTLSATLLLCRTLKKAAVKK